MWKKESKKNLKANQCVACTFTSNCLNLPETKFDVTQLKTQFGFVFSNLDK